MAPIGVIKVIWGSGWDPLLARDTAGHLAKRMEEALDGDYQMYSVSPGALQREHWVEQTPALKALMDSLSDEEISTIKRGGQDVKKLYAAYAEAAGSVGKPVVILAKTVKGDGMGGGFPGSEYGASEEKSEPERVDFARRLGIPLPERPRRRRISTAGGGGPGAHLSSGTARSPRRVPAPAK